MMTSNKLILAISLTLTLALTGCQSANTSTYGAALSTSSATRDTAAANAKTADREVAVLNRQVEKLQRASKRTARKLKRAEKRADSNRRKELASAGEKDAKALKRAERKLAKAERAALRARNKLERANRRVAAAEKRKKANDIRLAKIEKPRQDSTKTGGSLFALQRSGKIKYSDYKARVDGGFKLPAIPVDKMEKQFLRQRVDFRSSEKPGTLVVDTSKRFVYLVEGNNKAMRYGIGVGRAGFAWEGTATMTWKREWPTWTPPQEMIDRQPELAKYGGANGQKGGPTNPLGARALYIFQNGKDTLYRLHGTPQWASIGTAASSGCIRLINQDIIDLYARVPNGAKIIVKQG